MASVDSLVHETTTTTGTGDLTLTNANGKQPFNTAFGTGGTDAFYYFVSHQAAAEYEWGTGHLSASSTLVRDTVIKSTNSNAAVSFSAGTKDVTCDIPASVQSTFVPSSRKIIASSGLTGTGDLTVDRLISVGAGTGIVVNADDVAVDTSYLGANYQAKDSDLTTIAGLSPTNSDTLQYILGAWANRTPTQVKTTLSLTIGTDVQAYDAQLSSVMPSNGKTASYTLALTDTAKLINISGTTASQTITIPANSSVAFTTGTTISIYNGSTQSWSLAITTDTLTWLPSAGTGTRTIAAKGYATIQKIGSTSWIVFGVGIT